MTKPYWIWSHNRPVLKKEVCFFRKNFELNSIPEYCEVKISADTIYEFYINGKLIARDPQKSDRYRRYYRKIDISPYLQKGKNVLAAMVCHFINDEEGSRYFETGPISQMCSLRGGFLLICDTIPELSTDKSWRVLQSDSIDFVSPYLSRYATDMLHVNLRDYPMNFYMLDFDDSLFQIPEIVTDTEFERYGGITLWPLTESNIPPLEEVEIKPQRITRSNLLNAIDLIEKGSLVIQPGNTVFLEIDMGQLTTSHIELSLEYTSDKPLNMRISYAESYFKRKENGELYKQKRDDLNNAIFSGESDCIRIAQNYGETKPFKFRTVFFRTFRFLRIDIDYTVHPLKLSNLRFIETKYPLKVTGDYKGEGLENAIWDTSVRTLRLCMHNTYEDCPYYEQMQYTMDTALQMKYSYRISNDDRLARNAIDAFSASRMPDGLLACNYPAKFTQVIPGFAMFFIEMLADYYLYYADKMFTRKYMHVMDSVLQYFIQKLDGNWLFPRSDYWEFTDWVKEWHGNFGVPISKDEKIHTIYHEMLVYFLKRAAWLNKEMGFSCIADEYLTIAKNVGEAVRTHAFDKDRGLFTDTPGRKDYSVHAQIWAVLSGIVDEQEAIRLMHEVLNNKNLFQCSYSMSFYLFRALEQTGLYSKVASYMKTWEDMLALNMTTWCEDPVTQRSDCHGWSSLPIYEYTAMVLGVKPSLPGYKEILIQPFTEGRSRASGTVATAVGDVLVRWQKAGDKLIFESEIPAGAKAKIVLGDTIYNVDTGKHRFEVVL